MGGIAKGKVNFRIWSKAPTLPWKLENKGSVFFHVQRAGSRPLRKTFLGCKIGRGFKKDLQLKEAEKGLAGTSFLKYVLRKGREQGQEEACLG